ncbi:MAG: Holliday junction resolvase RuvX [Oscillospiraceae bacterium]|nr:Holliday junction resolvase RuvX [Oscillospiraceae bacterium]
MRIMAVDYGDARTGLAVSDLTGTIAGEAWVLHERNQSKVAASIGFEAENRSVKTIVIGHPKNMNGTIGPRALLCEALAEAVREVCDIEVILWDERMTTMGAHRILSDTGRRGKKRKNTVDAVAASLILESYLNSIS